MSKPNLKDDLERLVEFPPVSICDVPVDPVTMDETLALIECWVEMGGFRQIATANTDFVVQSLTDGKLRRVLQQCDLVVADGMPIVWASKKLGFPLPERVTGADLVPALANMSARKGYGIFMLGASQESSLLASQRLVQQYPGLKISGRLSPPPAGLNEMNHDAILTEIQDSKAQILLVAFGNPKQEFWIDMHKERLNAVCIGVGGSFDFLAGITRRAPAWIQRSGLEWLHRLSGNPGRLWKRYYRDIREFAPALWSELRAFRVTSNSAISVGSENSAAAPASLTDLVSKVGRANFVSTVQSNEEPIKMQLGKWTGDARSLGFLLRVVGQLRRAERSVCISGAMSPKFAELNVDPERKKPA